MLQKKKKHFLSLAPPSVSCLLERVHLQNIFRCFWKQTANPASPLSASRWPRGGSAARRRSCCSRVSVQLCCGPAGDKETSPIHHSQGCRSSCVQSSALLWSGMFLQSWKTLICWCTPAFCKESLLRDVSLHLKKKKKNNKLTE